MEALAFEDALHHIDNADRLVEADGALDLSRMRADALRGAGRVDDALAVLDAELARSHDLEAMNSLRLQRVQLLNDQFRAREGLADIEALLESAVATDDQELLLSAYLVKGRAHYILSLDQTSHAEQSRDAYEAAYEVAKRRGDRASMARALLPTTWFTDYWADYESVATVNIAEAVRLAEEVGDEDLILDAQSAKMHRSGTAMNRAASEELLARLEARRDPVKLNAHCFWMMWQYLWLGHFEESIATCDRGIELAELIGTQPVQYGSIKAIALTEMGRYDEVGAAIDQEVTDDRHPFGQAMASLARSVHLIRLAAWGPAAESLTDTFERATALSRVWMQTWSRSMSAVAASNLRVTGRTDLIPAVPREAYVDARFGDLTSGMVRAEIALIEGRPADALSLAIDRADRNETKPTLNGVRALDLVARAHLELDDLEAAAAAAGRGLQFAESMQLGSIIWRLRMVRSIALGASTDEAAAEFHTLAGRVRDPELRSWFERQPLAPH